MLPITILDSVSFLVLLVALAGLWRVRTCPGRRDLLPVIVLFASVLLLRDANNIAEWSGFGDAYDYLGDFIEALSPFCWVFLFYALISRRSRDELKREIARRSDAEAELLVANEELREALAALQESEERFRMMADFTYDWEYWISPEGQVVYMTPACERVTGYPASAFQEDPDLLARIVHPEDKAIYEAHASSASLDRPSPPFAFRIVRRDGESRWIKHVCRTVRDSRNTFVGKRASNRDITEERELEEQLRQSQKMEAVGQLAGGVAHDFNNLLQVICGYTGLVLDGGDVDDENREHLREVMQAAARATSLVQQLLTFSRQKPMNPAYLEPGALITGFLKMIQRVIGEQIEVQVELPESLPNVFADRSQIEQVLLNLCVNARDAMPNGGRVTIEARVVTCDGAFVQAHPWARTGDFIQVTVSDTGEGIAPEVISHVFEPFFSTKEPGKGSGLGLATVYGIVQQHGGMVNVSSVPEGGSTFEFYLPVAYGQQEPVPKQESLARAAGGSETILLAEDDPMVRGLTVKILQRAGYTVLPACDGDEAIRVFLDHSDSIHLCILDMVMPRFSGREVQGAIRRNRCDVPIIFCSGYGSDDGDLPASKGEHCSTLRKPYESAALLHAVRESLDRHAGISK